MTNWLRRAATDWLQIIAAYAAVAYVGWYAVPLAMLIVGTRQHALAILGHDGAHRLICRHKLLNDALACLVCFWPLGVPLGGYRRFHFTHHRTVGTLADPELIHKFAIPQWQTPLRWRSLALQVATDLCGGGLPHLFIVAVLARPVSWRDDLGPLATIGGASFASWYCGYPWVPALWFASMVTVFWAVFRLRIWTEHIGEQTTSRISTTPWQRWLFLPHNTWLHWEHHVWPNETCGHLPFYRKLLAVVSFLEDVPPVVTVGELFHSLTEDV